jgi:hypothetical protein
MKIITFLLVVLLTNVSLAQETHRIIGKIDKDSTIEVDSLKVKVKFRGQKKALEQAVGVNQTFYGKLIYFKRDKKFVFNAYEIAPADRTPRIEVYNDFYTVVGAEEEYCWVSTKYGKFKFFFRDMNEFATDNIKKRKKVDFLSLIFYYDEDTKEICVKLPSPEEMTERMYSNGKEVRVHP